MALKSTGRIRNFTDQKLAFANIPGAGLFRDGVSEKQELSMSCEQNLPRKRDRVLEMHFALFNQ
jgi:hypothetical protein